MRGTIDQIWENESRNGQKYLAVQIDGERYSAWDTEYFELIQEAQLGGHHSHCTAFSVFCPPSSNRVAPA